MDAQVKVRGFRIEPGEVEAALALHPAVREAAVIARDDAGEGPRLVAYVATAGGDAPSPAELRAHLRARLPEHMVPSAFVVLDALPLTPNGKLDRRALPAPAASGAEGGLDEPADYVEAQLIPLWEELLGVPGIGPEQGFFDLGGDSLLSLRLLAQVQRRFGCELPVASLFAEATVRHMARAIQERQGAAPDAPGAVVPLQPHGTLPPLFVLHPAGRSVVAYVSLVRHLGLDQPVYGVRDVGDDLSRPVSQIAAEHLAAVREVQPEGPYHLAGWSFGGLVAFEMALQLERAGETAAFVGLLDTVSPVLMERWAWDGDEDTMLVLARDVAARSRRPFTLPRQALAGLSTEEQLRAVVRALHDQGAAPVAFDEAVLADQVHTVRARRQSRAGYVPGRFDGWLTLFRAVDELDGFDDFLAPCTDEERRTLAWSRYAAPPVEVYRVPGSHATIGSEPHVRVLAARVRDALAAARLRAASAAPRDGAGTSSGIPVLARGAA
jgi:thioesterase domain-containing protein/acyl carrier protein